MWHEGIDLSGMKVVKGHDKKNKMIHVILIGYDLIQNQYILYVPYLPINTHYLLSLYTIINNTIINFIA